MNEVSRAAAALRAGELVAFPTETVYGLGADARNPAAVGKIFVAKGRPADHPLIVHLPDVSHLSRWAREVPETAFRLAAAFWPGPLTLILRRHESVIDAITGGQDTVGLRVPKHPLALELLRAFDGGIAAPSANRFGHVSPTTAAHVRDEFGDSVSIVLDGGPCAVGIESTILDLSGDTPRILRPGMIDVAALEGILGAAPAVGATSGTPRVSGSMESHYSPTTALQLVAGVEVVDVARQALGAGRRVVVYSPHAAELVHPALVWRVAAGDPVRYAQELYACLREFDGLRCDVILAVRPPESEAWRAVVDRLTRASAGTK